MYFTGAFIYYHSILVEMKTKKESANDLKKRKHHINKDAAVKMIQDLKGRKGKKMPELPIAVAFNREGIQQLLDLPGCIGLRAYFALNAENKVTLVLAGMDEEGEDILTGGPSPAVQMMARTEGETGLLDEAQLCPPFNAGDIGE